MPRGKDINDINFKLSVLSALMDDGHYEAEAKAIKLEHLDTAEDFKPIPQVMDFYRSIEIPPKLLATVTSLSPDGGDLAYLYAMSEWDGEDDQFEIKSIEGIEQARSTCGLALARARSSRCAHP